MKKLLIVLSYVVIAYSLTIENIPRKRQKRGTTVSKEQQIKDALIKGQLNSTMIEKVKQAIINRQLNGTGLYELLNMTTPMPPFHRTLPFDFWRPAATKASEIMNTLYQDSKFVYTQTETHFRHVYEGLWKMGFIMWLGICPSTTSTTPLPTGWMREKLEKYYGKNFMDYGLG